MANVCVITGGSAGMGLCAAKCMPKDKIIVVAGRSENKLEKAVKELKEAGYDAYGFSCDTSDRLKVRALAEYASSLGNVTNVINAAGLSPNMAKPEMLLRVNALGTVYVNSEFEKVMGHGSVIVDVASNSAYVLPKFLISEKLYSLATINEGAFLEKCIKRSNLPKGEYEKSGFAYALSKNFVIWYAKKCAFEYAKKGIRVVSISPGLVATDMGKLEEKEGQKLIELSCEGRMGTPEELGFAIASLADERNGYLSGVDVLCDGGSTTGKHFKKHLTVG